MENLRSLQRQGTNLVENQPRKARSLHNSAAANQFHWKQCINRPRPSKLDLVKATEDAGIVRRLESPAAISLLSPRPYNRQNCVPTASTQVRVPPLDFSNLNSLSSSSQSYEVIYLNSNFDFTNYTQTWKFQNMTPMLPQHHYQNHLLLQNAQRNAVESNHLLKSLRKYGKYLPQKWAGRNVMQA